VDRFSVFAKSKISRWVKIPQQDSAERAFNKLARTFAAQVETLKRYRGGGEQTMPRRYNGSRWPSQSLKLYRAGYFVPPLKY